jgi:hypothetical protein
MARRGAGGYEALMPAARAHIHASLTLFALLGGCGQGDLFARFPDSESAAVTASPYPALAEGPALLAAAGPAPDPAAGAAVVDGLTADAAVAQAETERLSGPVFDVDALRRDAEAVRQGR